MRLRHVLNRVRCDVPPALYLVLSHPGPRPSHAGSSLAIPHTAAGAQKVAPVRRDGGRRRLRRWAVAGSIGTPAEVTRPSVTRSNAASQAVAQGVDDSPRYQSSRH